MKARHNSVALDTQHDTQGHCDARTGFSLLVTVLYRYIAQP